MAEVEVDLLPQRRGVERRELHDQREVDQVLDAGADPPALIGLGVGVELLGDLKLERDRGDPDRFDPGEAEEVIRPEGLDTGRIVGPQADVEEEGLEGSARERGRDPEAMGAAKSVRGRPGPLDREDEEVAGVVLGGIQQRVGQFVLRGPPLDVDVFGAPRPRGQPQVQGEPALQHPAVRRHGLQADEQPIEGDALPGAAQRGAVACPVLQPLLQRHAKAAAS